VLPVGSATRPDGAALRAERHRVSGTGVRIAYAIAASWGSDGDATRWRSRAGLNSGVGLVRP
jgi:hypothetical protein